jgi:methylthioribose-1-phosphate isomerase
MKLTVESRDWKEISSFQKSKFLTKAMEEVRNTHRYFGIFPIHQITGLVLTVKLMQYLK